MNLFAQNQPFEFVKLESFVWKPKWFNREAVYLVKNSLHIPLSASFNALNSFHVMYSFLRFVSFELGFFCSVLLVFQCIYSLYYLKTN